MIANIRFYSLLFLAILPFLFSCAAQQSSFEKISSKQEIAAIAKTIQPFKSLSGDVRIDISYLGKSVKGKGYLYYRDGKLRVLLLNPMKMPLYDLIVYPEASYLIDYQHMEYLDLGNRDCVKSGILPDNFSAVLPMLFLDFSEANLAKVRALHRDEAGRVSGLDYMGKENNMQRLVSVQYLNYQDIKGRQVPGKILITNSGHDITIELLKDIVPDGTIKDKVFNLKRLNDFKDLCAEN